MRRLHGLCTAIDWSRHDAHGISWRRETGCYVVVGTNLRESCNSRVCADGNVRPYFLGYHPAGATVEVR